MNHCKVPCIECPFRKDSLPGWLGPHTAQELHSIVMAEFPFPCHMTHNGVSDWDSVIRDNIPICAGALIYMRKGAKLPINKDLNEAMKSFSTKDFDNILSIREFFKHHSNE